MIRNKVQLKTVSSYYVDINEIIYYINEFRKTIGDNEQRNYDIEVSPLIYNFFKYHYVKIGHIQTFMGLEIGVNPSLMFNEICICYERNVRMNVNMNSISFSTSWVRVEEKKLPDKVQFNKKKKATTLIFDKDVVVVKQNEKDKEDYEKAFLWAYFVKKSGLSKTQASKYIDKIMEECK